MRRLEVGDQLGRYKILKRLGAGAMGEVFLAEDPHIGRQVALKTVRMEEGRATEIEERKRRLLREARAAGRLLHTNIVTLFDTGEDGEILYLAFEFVEGKDLADRAAEGAQLSLGEVLSIVRQAAEGLDYAHRQGVVHRDIKPSNLMITADGRVKIADFGIARVADQTSDLTMTGSVVGSPHYMSPEQIKGEELDGRTDIFSLGVLLYEILCRRRPFEGETLTTLVYQILNQEPTSLVVRRPELGPRLEQLVRRMMHKDRDQRFASASEVAREIVACERELSAEQLAGAALREESSGGTVRMADRPPAPPPPPVPGTPPASAPPPAPPPPSAAISAGAAAGPRKTPIVLIAVIVVVVLGGLVAAGLAARKFVAARLAKIAVVEPGATPTAAPATRTTPVSAPTPVAVATVAPAFDPTPAPVDPALDPGTRATLPTPEPTPIPIRPTPVPVRPTPVPERPNPTAVPTVERGEPSDPREMREALMERMPVDREMSTGMNLSFDVQPKDAAEQVIVRLDRTVIGRAFEWNAKKRDGRSYSIPEPGMHILSFVLDGTEIYRIRIDAQPGGGTTTVTVNLPQAGRRSRRPGGR